MRLGLRRGLAFLMMIGLPIVAQNRGSARPFPSTDQIGSFSSDAGIPSAAHDAIRQQKKMLALLNAERQRNMVSDANKLLRLAQELNADMNRPDADISPAQRVHKIAEIEKLARSVKDKMSYAIGISPGVANTLTLTMQ